MSGTDYTLTPNLGLYKPLPTADINGWGAHLNSNADTLDTALHGGPFLPTSGGTVTGPTLLQKDTAFLPATGGTLGLCLYGAVSGSMGSVGNVAPFEIIIPSNSVDSTGNAGSGFWAQTIQHNFGGTKGGQGSLMLIQTQTADLADTASVFINPFDIILTLNHSGIGMGNGIASAAEVRVAGPGWGLIEANEDAIFLTAGSAVTQAYVTTSIWNAVAHATLSDAFECYITGAGNAFAPRSVWQLGRNDSQWPVDPAAGWLMTTVQQITNNPGNTRRLPQMCAGGLDFSRINFSNAALRSSGVSLESAVVKVGSGRLSQGVAGLVVDTVGTIGAVSSISAAGAGYQVNDQLYDGLGGIIQVSAVGGGGAITAAAYIGGREPYFFGTGPATVTTTGGSGNGAVFSVIWSANSTLSLNPTGKQLLTNLAAAATDAAAATAGVPIGGLYNNAGVVHVRLT